MCERQWPEDFDYLFFFFAFWICNQNLNIFISILFCTSPMINAYSVSDSVEKCYNHNTQCSIFFSQTCVVYGSLDSNFHLHLQVFCSRDFKPMFINKILCCFSLHLQDFNPSFLFFFYFRVFWTYGRIQTNPWMEMQSTDRPSFRVCKWTLKHESISVWCPETWWGSSLQQGSNSQPECRKEPVVTIGPWLQPYFH